YLLRDTYGLISDFCDGDDFTVLYIVPSQVFRGETLHYRRHWFFLPLGLMLPLDTARQPWRQTYELCVVLGGIARRLARCPQAALDPPIHLRRRADCLVAPDLIFGAPACVGQLVELGLGDL